MQCQVCQKNPATVHVTDSQGHAVSTARILAVPAAARAQRTRFGAIDARPDANGDITLGPLPAGDYLIVAVTADDLNLLFFDPDRFAELAAIATKATFREDERTQIDLRLVTLPDRR